MLLNFAVLGLAACNAFSYMMAAHEKPCFFETTTDADQQVSFFYAVLQGGNYDVDVSVTDGQGKTLHRSAKERQGDFVFKVERPGTLSFCFSNGESSAAAKLIEFEIIVQKDQPKVNNLSSLESTIAKLKGDLHEIHVTYKFLKARLSRNFDTVQSIERRVLQFSVFEALLIVGMSCVQVYILKSLFTTSNKFRI